MSFADLVFSSILANNLLFFHYFGVGEFLKEGGDTGLARRALVLGVILVGLSLLFWVPDHFLLQPFHLEFLRTLVVALLVALVSLGYKAVLGALPGPWPQVREVSVHGFLVGGLFLVAPAASDLLTVLAGAVAVAVGYAGALILLVSVFQRMSRERLPQGIQGLPLQLLTFGLVWLVLQGLGLAFAGKAA